MKNFTKQNFKTNPLWIRLLIMTFMLLAGAGNVWAKTLYFKANNYWIGNTNRYSAYFYGNGEKWVSMKIVDGETQIFECEAPSGYPNVIFCAMNKNTTGNTWGDKWNQTNDLTIPTDTKNYYIYNDNSWDKGNGTWSTYTPPCNVAVSVSKSPDQSVYLTGENVTLTATTANETSFAWKEGSTQLSTSKTYSYTKNTVGSVTLKAVATASCGNAEKEVVLSFVNQKKIVVKCKGADNIHLYTWNGTNTDDTNTWPGATTTKEGDYYVWEISTETPINIQFNKGSNNPQTKDINGLQVGYEYVFTWSGKHDESISLPTPTELPKPCTKPDKPSIDLSTSSICKGDDTQVTITVKGEAEEYALYVVNNGYTKQGNSQESKTFTKTPSATTTYAVKAFNGTCESDFSEPQTVTVSDKPSITLNPTSKTICKGDELDLSTFASSTATLTWWNGQTQITAPVSPGTNTTYTVKAINGACTVTKDFTVTVKELQGKPVFTTPNTTVCESTAFNLPAIDKNGATLVWYTSNGASQNASVSAGITTQTVYYAAIAASDDKCETASNNRTAYTVNVDTKPAITLKPAPTICEGSTIVFSNYVQPSTGTITWHTDANCNEAAITSATPSQTTTYYAKATNGVCSTPATASLIITVKTAPTKPDITLNPADGNIISGNSATLSVNSPVNGYTYTLYEETRGKIETGKTSFTISNAGNYYVKATNDCEQESPASDPKTITICTPNATLVSATYNQSTGKIDLSGNLTETCGKTIYYGFLWKVKGDDWNTNNAISGTGNSYNSTSTNNTEFNQSWANAEDGTTYVFTAYALNTATNPDTWYYDETGIEVSKCITVATPNVTAEPICLGNEATLTLSNKQDNVVYTLDGVEIFKIGNTHTVTPGKTPTYTITATSAISCEANQTETTTVEVEVYELPDAPTINEETTVCPNTPFTLPTIDGDGNWYAQAKGGNAYASTTINGITETTYYYAEAVKYGCASATRTQYTVNVHTAPVAPIISLNPATVGQDKNSVLSISNETYSPSNTKYELYKGSEKVGEMTAQTTNVSSSNVGDVIYSVKATHKECTALTSTSNEVTLTVQEAGAIIATLGDLKVDPQDPVDFVAMYVKNDGLADYTDQGATKVTGYTWEFSSDGGNTWTPCVSTATIGVTNGSDKCNNFRPSAEGKYRCKVTYDKGEQTSNVLTVTGDGSTARTFKGVTMNIPVISVNTGKEKFPTCDGLSGTASKNADVIKEKISVDVKIFNADGTVYYDRKARMNYRGSSSLNFVKKSYAFCTGKEKTKNDKGAVDTGKENLFGLSNGVEDKDWVLYAAAADPSIMRNRLMFDTFRDMTGGWSVGSMYVELVVNGEYKGVYVLMDKITANMGDEEKNIGGRVKVEWKLDKQGNTTQEGFIVKFDKTDIVDRYENTSGDQKTFKSTYSGHDGFTTYDTQIDQRFEIEYPEKEDIEEEDLDNNKGAGDWSLVFNSIKEKFNKFEYELAKGNFTEVQKLIDYQSWADWFIITEFGKNIDGYRASNFFVYDGSKANAKIEARPLWDQELSFDNQCPNYYASYGANNASGFMVDKSNDEAYNNDASTPFWFTGRYTGGRGTYNGSNQTFKGLLDDPCFVAMVKTRWAKHKADALSQDKLNAKVTAYTNEMGAAKEREATFWSTRSRGTCQCSYSGSTGYEYVSFDDSKKAITEWIGKRPAGLNTAIEALKGLDLTISLTVTPDGGEITPWEAVMVKVNNPSGYDYDLNYTTNTLDKVEGVIISENNDKYTYRIPRPSTWGTGDGERDAIEYGIQAILNVADDNLQCGTINEEFTKADVTITLKDEEDDNCSIVEP